jgi:hypothetical protein
LDIKIKTALIYRDLEKHGEQEKEKKEPQELIRNDDNKITFSLGGKKPLIDVKPTPFLLGGKNVLTGAKISGFSKDVIKKEEWDTVGGPSTSSASGSGHQQNLNNAGSKKPASNKGKI